jgi:thiol-disulfide isomerase/thioredoxin
MTTCCLKFKLSFAFLFLILLLPGFDAFAQKKEVTITGNINNLVQNPGLVDVYSFKYSDLATDKDVIIPITKDAQGNFKVVFAVNGYQEVSLCQAAKLPKGVNLEAGVTQFNFYVSPGQHLNFSFYMSADYSDRKIIFTKDGALFNNQMLAYYNSLQRSGVDDSLRNQSDELVKKGIPYLKKYLNEQLASSLEFNNKYFGPDDKTGKNPKDKALGKGKFNTVEGNMVKKQAELNLRYSAANALMRAMVVNNVNDPQAMDYLKEFKVKLNEPAAYGTDIYKDFLHHYFMVMGRAADKKAPDVIILNKDIATFIVQNHPELEDDDKALAKKILDTINKPSEDEINRFLNQVATRYVNEYMANRPHNLPAFDYALTIKDPFLRDLYATRVLYQQINGNIGFIKPNLSAYLKNVGSGYIKDDFLAYYQQEIDKINNSKLPPKAVLYSPKQLTGTDPFKSAIAKYKGKVIYVDVWATWCMPCLGEMENSQKLREKLAGKDVVFVYLCISSPDDKTWKSLIGTKNIEGENYFLNYSQSQAILKTFKITGIPYYLLVNKDGAIAKANAGRPADDETFDNINNLLSK